MPADTGMLDVESRGPLVPVRRDLPVRPDMTTLNGNTPVPSTSVWDRFGRVFTTVGVLRAVLLRTRLRRRPVAVRVNRRTDVDEVDLPVGERVNGPIAYDVSSRMGSTIR